MARVLVVDDDPALLRALRVSLNLKGHEVLTAATG
jgi:DNA-binding response OmpR family regulator